MHDDWLLCMPADSSCFTDEAVWFWHSVSLTGFNFCPFCVVSGSWGRHSEPLVWPQWPCLFTGKQQPPQMKSIDVNMPLFNPPMLTWCAIVTSLPLHYCINIRAVKLLYIPCRHSGWMDLWLYMFLDFILIGTEWSASCLSCFTHSSLWLGWWWALELVWTFWRNENLLCL
jgi:hypothetical protein